MANRVLPGTALTARELEAALLAAEGLTDRQVAGRMGISERTVHSHLRAAYVKTGTRNRVQLRNCLAASAARAAITARGNARDANAAVLRQ